MTDGESATPDQQALIERFTDEYRLGTDEVVRAIERRV